MSMTFSPSSLPTADPTPGKTRNAFVETVGDDTFQESCIAENDTAVFWIIMIYGIIGSLYILFKSARSFHKVNKENNPKYKKMLFSTRILYFFQDFIEKRNIIFILNLHVWNQATDLGVVVEMYFISFSECS